MKDRHKIRIETKQNYTINRNKLELEYEWSKIKLGSEQNKNRTEIEYRRKIREQNRIDCKLVIISMLKS